MSHAELNLCSDVFETERIIPALLQRIELLLAISVVLFRDIRCA